MSYFNRAGAVYVVWCSKTSFLYGPDTGRPDAPSNYPTRRRPKKVAAPPPLNLRAAEGGGPFDIYQKSGSRPGRGTREGAPYDRLRNKSPLTSNFRGIL